MTGRDERIRVAVVGTGGIATGSHLPTIQAHRDRVELVAAVDVDPGRVAQFCARADITAGYTDVDEMLAAQRPDLVHVCTPPAEHIGQLESVLAAGSWAWVEKPPCRTLAEFDRITAAEQASGAYAAVVFQHRFGSAGMHAADLIAAGELGRPLLAQCTTTWYRPPAYFTVPWRGSWASEGGGPTMGHGIHQMDLLLTLLGPWEEVTALAGRLDRDVETEDVSLALVRFTNGALASVTNSILSPREESYLRIDLSDATVELTHLYGYRDSDWTYTAAPHVPEQRRQRWRTPTPDVPSSHAAQFPLLLAALRAGTRPPASGAGVRSTLELVTALYQSALTGRSVRRTELVPQNPFYHALHGDTVGWAPARSNA
ncbi:Gfo/Idh/MocA family protein [Micromonospora humida]|uniref:Gfo/Idh/MocA family oxidoreductase n=1 Tax=Micromonospora humida TaxID=2809018 RepID=A0ABS2ISP7_9ACTN|nr:Gfo/Idh/MocA family oxidoreductase [Micromonospora humida]MBM7077064.1 Gfo/Idh/MocA family oxidoreductase [Micromonospora humida]